MNDVMQIQTASDPSSTPAVAAPPPPPPPHRRPRVREVSSRFMSPVASSTSSSSSSCGDPHLVSAKSPLHRPNHLHQKHRRHQDAKETDHLTTSTDENRPIDTARSLESPFHFQRRLHHQQARSAVMKLFSENGSKRSRPDTPMTTVTTTSSKPNRLLQRSTTNTTATAATKLLQSLSTHQPSNTNNASQEDTTSVTSDDTSSQFSLDADMLPTVSARLLGERNGNTINRVNGNVASTPFSRSLNLSLSASQQSMFSSRGSDKTTPALSRSFSNPSKIGGLSLPPVPPPSVKPGADAKRGGKKASSQEDVHALKMLHNRYLQWRFANAKSEASAQAQRRETERMLYSLGLKISDLYDSVKRKRIELGLLQRMKTLSAIVEAQMPYLDQWSAFEGDYSVSLSEIIQALLNTSFQLPIGGNVKADVREIGDALNSAAKLMETIISHIQSFLPKANEMEILVSELAKVTGGEKALIEECGVLLSKTHAFQVEECSLRGQIMQSNQRLRAPSRFQEDANSSSLNAVHMR